MSTDADGEDSVRTVALNMKMSRGLKAEYQVQWHMVEDMEVFDQFGKSVKFGDIYRKQKAIIVFVRHFLCFMATEYVQDLAKIPARNLAEHNVELVLIGPAPWKFIEHFRQTTGFPFTIYVDPSLELFQAMDCKPNVSLGDVSKAKDSKHIKSNFVSGTFRAAWRGMKFCEFMGDVNQQGGAFVIGPGEELHYSRHCKTPRDLAPVNDLLFSAEVPPVNFPHDTRIMTL